MHLIEDERLVASAREHILRHDEAPPDWPDDAKSALDLHAQGDIVTRSLGRAGSRPEETTVWTPQGPYRVVSCSADAHRNRAPEEYAVALHTDANLGAWSDGAGSVFLLAAT